MVFNFEYWNLSIPSAAFVCVCVCVELHWDKLICMSGIDSFSNDTPLKLICCLFVSGGNGWAALFLYAIELACRARTITNAGVSPFYLAENMRFTLFPHAAHHRQVTRPRSPAWHFITLCLTLITVADVFAQMARVIVFLRHLMGF